MSTIKRASGPVIKLDEWRGQDAGITLDDLADKEIWVWHDQEKEPHQPLGPKAASNNADTWSDRAECDRAVAKQRRYGRVADVGIRLGSDCGDGTILLGIDGDALLDPVTSEPLPEHAETVAELLECCPSYTEISRSKTGFKIYFRVKSEDLIPLIASLGGASKKEWRSPAPSARERSPGIELHTASFFITTACHLTGSPRDLRVLPGDAVTRIIREIGPGFARTDPSKGKSDGRRNRSGDALRIAGTMFRAGKSYEEFTAAIRTTDDPALAAWYAEKGCRAGLHHGERVEERELHRAWDEAAGDDFERDSKRAIIPNSQVNIRLGLAKLGVRVAHDVFADRTLVDGPDDKPRRHLGDPELESLYLSVDARFGFRPSIDFFRMVVQDEARQNAFHPVREYLDGLQWDGNPRLEQWLVTYADADDSDYVRAVGKLVLIAAVRRVRQPGCKFDEMLVLESAQGLDKSSALATLAGVDEWFTDSLPLGVDDRKVVEILQGKWIVEASELAGMRKSEIETLKSFLSRRIDRARPAYGRLPVEAPRQCLIIGTTNSERYLRDSTGNRRFWPVKVERFDLDALRRDRDQLWAEAAAAEAAGESIRLDPRLYPDAGMEQEARTVADPWVAVIRDALGDRYGKMKTEGAWTIVNVSTDKRTQEHNARLGDAMRALGWKHEQRRFDGKREYAYVKRHPEGNDRGGKLLPIIHVSRSELNGELDIFVGKPEIETEKEPLSATIRKAMAGR
jgi:hypothetical protein